MFKYKVRSNLPTISKKSADTELKGKLQAYRHQQAQYYNMNTKSLPPLQQSQSVRIQNPITSKWEPAVVNKVCDEPRSYIVKGSLGGIYRRNRKHIRTTGELFKLGQH